MTVTVRRRLALGLVVAASVIVGVTILAAVDGGYGWGHIYLRPLAHPFLGTALAAGMLGVAAQLSVSRRVPRVGSQVAAAVVAAMALCSGLLVTWMEQTFGVSGESVVASSPEFKLVSYHRPVLFRSGDIVLRVQSREGLASRESGQDLACFIDASGLGPEWLFDRASFTGAGEITVFTKDGTRWQARFDTTTLSPVQPLDRCTNAPDPMAD